MELIMIVHWLILKQTTMLLCHAESHSQLTDHQLQELLHKTDPLSDDGNNGINYFLYTVTITEGFTEQ